MPEWYRNQWSLCEGQNWNIFLKWSEMFLFSWSFIKITSIKAASSLKQAVHNFLHHRCFLISRIQTPNTEKLTWKFQISGVSANIFIHPAFHLCLTTIRTTFPRSLLILNSGSIRMRKLKTILSKLFLNLKRFAFIINSNFEWKLNLVLFYQFFKSPLKQSKSALIKNIRLNIL